METSRAVRIAVLTDLHLASPGTPSGRWIGTLPFGRSTALLRRAAERVGKLSPDAVALLGDLTQDGTEEQLDLLTSAVPAFGCPVWAVPGNHDLGRGPDPLRGVDGAVQVPEPSGSDVAGFLVAAGRLARSDDGAAYREDAVPDPRDWPAAPMLWLSHFPVVGLEEQVTAAGLPYAGDLVNSQSVLAALSRHRAPVVVLAGHLHVRATAVRGQVLQFSHPALIEPPHQLTLLELRSSPAGLRVTRRAHALLDTNGGTDPALAPPTEAWTFAHQTWRPDDDP